MGRSQESFQKKEVRKRKQKKRQDKQKKKLEKKDTEKSGELDDMIAYVDENGMLTDTPPDLTRKRSPKAADIEVSIPKRDASEPGHKVKQGRLTFLNEIKGYGFINENGTGQSIFVHVTDFQDEINKGDQVSFEIGKGQRGPSAFNVKRLK
ncbi:MAG: cold shock domain-containing protein [Bacteroidota bacterium]